MVGTAKDSELFAAYSVFVFSTKNNKYRTSVPQKLFKFNVPFENIATNMYIFFIYTPSKYLTEDPCTKIIPGAVVINFAKVNRQNSTPRSRRKLCIARWIDYQMAG